MSIFDELMSKVDDNYDEPTFESEFDSLLNSINNEDTMYEAETNEKKSNQISPEEVAEIKAKAKKVKKAIVAALAVLATILVVHHVVSNRSANGAEIARLKSELAAEKRSKDKNNAKIKELENKIAELKAENEKVNSDNKKMTKELNGVKADKLQQELNDIKQKIDAGVKKSGNRSNCTPEWAKDMNKLFDKAYSLISQVQKLRGNGRKSMQAAKSDINWLNAAKNQSAQNLGKRQLNYVNGNKNLKALADKKDYELEIENESSMDDMIKFNDYQSYVEFMENASTKCIDDEISFNELLILTEKAIDRFGEIVYDGDMITESEIPEEYEQIMEIICEKFDNNDITLEEAVLLMEKAGDKYLESTDEDDYTDFDGMTSEEFESALENDDYGNDDVTTESYDSRFNRIVDAICERYNNNEITPDDTVLLLEKANNIFTENQKNYIVRAQKEREDGKRTFNSKMNEDENRKFNSKMDEVADNRQVLNKMKTWELEDLVKTGGKILDSSTSIEREHNEGYFRQLVNYIGLLKDEIRGRKDKSLSYRHVDLGENKTQKVY